MRIKQFYLFLYNICTSSQKFARTLQFLNINHRRNREIENDFVYLMTFYNLNNGYFTHPHLYRQSLLIQGSIINYIHISTRFQEVFLLILSFQNILPSVIRICNPFLNRPKFWVCSQRIESRSLPPPITPRGHSRQEYMFFWTCFTPKVYSLNETEDSTTCFLIYFFEKILKKEC